MQYLDRGPGVVADELMEAQDGITEQQREFRIEVIEPRHNWVAQLAIWDSQQPHINRGDE